MTELHPELITKNGKPEFVVLPYEEYLEVRKALARLEEKKFEDPRYGGFWDNLTAEELARRQGVKPIQKIEALYGPGNPEDWEGFDEALERWRRQENIGESNDAP